MLGRPSAELCGLGWGEGGRNVGMGRLRRYEREEVEGGVSVLCSMRGVCFQLRCPAASVHLGITALRSPNSGESGLGGAVGEEGRESL